MIEPVSFVASVIGIATLAENVVTKGYRYLKAARNCSDEVRTLMAEVNVLCSILKRLEILLQTDKPNQETEDDAENHANDNSQSHEAGINEKTGFEDSSTEFSKNYDPPDFIYECQKTLFEIEGILNRFGHSSPQSTQSINHPKRVSLSGIRRHEPRDLKWPLERSKTLLLIQALERHKNTCIMALTKDGLVGIHTVLEQTKLTNKYLADLRANQGKMLELSHNQEQGL